MRGPIDIPCPCYDEPEGTFTGDNCPIHGYKIDLPKEMQILPDNRGEEGI